MTLPTMLQMRPETWEWEAGHPEPARPYFEEFAPLISGQGRGVAGYQAAFAFDQFFAQPDTRVPKLFEYIDSLVKLAQSAGKTSVLKFSRSSGRIGWMRNKFPGAANVAFVRNPWHQWLSGWRIFVRHGNPYFVAQPLAILVMHRRHPYVAAAAEALQLRLNAQSFPLNNDASRVRAIPTEVLYRGFLAFWTVTTFDSHRYAQHMIESDLLGQSPAYRADIEQLLAMLTGAQLDLSSARAGTRPSSIAEISEGDLEQIYSDALRACSALERMTSDARSTAAADFVRAKLAEAATVLPVAGPR